MADLHPLLALITDQRRAITQAQVAAAQEQAKASEVRDILRTTVRKAHDEGVTIEQLIDASQMSFDELTECLNSAIP